MDGPVRKFSLLCDLDGKIQRVLDDSEKLFGDDAVGSMFFPRVVHNDLEKVLNFFIELKSKGSAIGWDINISCPDGPVTFSFFGGIFGDSIGIAASTTANGAKQMFTDLTRLNNEQINIIRNLTNEKARLLAEKREPGAYQFDEMTRLNNELVNIQRELAKKNHELDRLNNLKNQFLGIVAHDLRNPLGIILGFSELLADPNADVTEEERNEMTGRIHQTGKFMLHLINNLLDVANIESGKFNLSLTRENLVKLVQENISMNSMLARSKNITVKFNSPVENIEVMIDRGKIEQAFTNYLTNAIKYSFFGSEIEVNLTVFDNTVRVTVRDQGQGIMAEEVDRLFRVFQRASSRTTGGEKSTGLGLFIVKKIIDAHGGQVGVTSVLGKGSDFFLTLPLNRINE
jgi:signal transduction histidine kinase